MQRSNLECWFLWREENRKPREKPSEQAQEPTQTDSTYDICSRNQSWAALVGDDALTTAPPLTLVI